MFDNALIILTQLLKMFLYILIGFFLYRGKLIGEKGSTAIANLLIYACLPCVILNSLNVDRTPETVRTVLYSLMAGGIAAVVAMLAGLILFRKNPIDRFAAAFSNAAFLGIPLITSALGSGAAIYITGFLLIQGFGQWTFNSLFFHREGEKAKVISIFTSPITISLILGFVLFFTGLRLPKLLGECVGSLAACNSPIATVMLGVYIGQTRLSEIFTTPRLYLVSAVRLLFIPILTVLALSLVPAEFMDLRTAVLISSSAPVAVITAAYSQKGGLDYTYATKAICLSTILSLITLPLTMVAAGLIW